MNRQHLTLYGLKWNPFATDLPVEGLMTTPAVDSFCRRIEHHLVRQGGFALIAGEPGIGKSVALRLLANRLERTEGLNVAVLTHPSSNIGDFYREMADLFGISLVHNNLWVGFKGLRQRWLGHLEDTRMRPLLLVDEAQEIPNPVLTEMRLLTSTDFDSRAILSVVLAGDNRLLAKLRSPDLQPGELVGFGALYQEALADARGNRLQVRAAELCEETVVAGQHDAEDGAGVEGRWR